MKRLAVSQFNRTLCALNTIFPADDKRLTVMHGAPPDRIVQTVALLATSVMELRRIADDHPDTATELRQIANQLEAEANDLAKLSSNE